MEGDSVAFVLRAYPNIEWEWSLNLIANHRVLAHILSIRHALLSLVSGGDSPIYIFAAKGSRACQRSKHFIYFLFIFCWHTLKMPKILSHKQKPNKTKNKQTNDKDGQKAKKGIWPSTDFNINIPLNDWFSCFE